MRLNNYQGSLQNPLSSGFSKFSTAMDVIEGIDLSGKIAIVTGGNSGIGLETTKVLSNAGATVIVTARDIAKAKNNLNGLSNIEMEPIDLMDPNSIDSFAKKFLATGRPLHLLINNAGIMWVPLRKDPRGFESQLVTNYLAQFHLTAKVWPALKTARGSRVINVSSSGHHFAPFDFKDPHFQIREYDTLEAYGQSKTASNLFALELDSRAREYDVQAFSLHPGSIYGTELAREASLDMFINMGFCDSEGNILPEVKENLKSVPQGAATTVWCATSPLLDKLGGVYCEDCNIARLAEEKNGFEGVRSYSLDRINAQQLWDLTEKMLGFSFKII